MDNLLVLGGRQRPDAQRRDEWQRYDLAIAGRIETDSGRAERLMHYESPPGAVAVDNPAVVFKSGCLANGTLFACTQTEVLLLDATTGERRAYYSLPSFNDVHHVRPYRGDRLLVTVTGLDLVQELSLDGTILREWSVLGEDTWERFDRSVDYRRVLTTKPHKSHPNYTFTHGDDIWVTRFKQRDAVCLTDSDDPAKRRRIKVGGGRGIHDGHVRDGQVFFTTVDGSVVIADLETCEVLERYDLNRLTPGTAPLGWCRGLLVEEGYQLLVGFSRIRPTRLRENLTWIKHQFGSIPQRGLRPTRVARYDLEKGSLLREYDVEDLSLHTLFSIHSPSFDDVSADHHLPAEVKHVEVGIGP